jgi:hypothetical protein
MGALGLFLLLRHEFKVQYPGHKQVGVWIACENILWVTTSANYRFIRGLQPEI